MNKQICRICLNTNNLRHIFESFDNTTFASNVMFISRKEITETDGLPQYICENCIKRVEQCNQLLLQIEKTHQYLLSLTLKKAIHDPTTETDSEEARMQIHDEFKQDNTKLDTLQIVHPYHETEKETLASSTSKQKLRKLNKCSLCEKEFATKFALTTHVRAHTGEKPFQCQSCDKVFASSYNLKVHERTHSGEKPISCSICSKKFTQSAGLICHMRLHSGESPYKCHLCPKKFKTSSHLRYHVKLHTGEKNHVCPTCQKGFVTKSDLTQHLKTHTGERTHVCSICGIQLSRAYHLMRHMVTHTGEKNFTCDVCGQMFSQNYDVKRHKKTHEHRGKVESTREDGTKHDAPDESVLNEEI